VSAAQVFTKEYTMTEFRKDFPEIAGILTALDAADGIGGKPFNTNDIPANLRSIERKYDISSRSDEMPFRRLEFQHMVFEHVRQGSFILERSEVFTGVDLCLCLGGNGKSVTKRLRFGSNRPAQMSTKVPIDGTDGQERGQYNVLIRHEDIPKVRADFEATAQLVEKSKLFLVGQSGEFWFVRDKQDRLIEIALYKAGRVEADVTTPLRLFAEIAPWGYPPFSIAIATMGEFEALLSLENKQCKQSLAEVFG
jgi:hypothetical protein